jgi:hypothetical protein
MRDLYTAIARRPERRPHHSESPFGQPNRGSQWQVAYRSFPSTGAR